MEDQGLQRQTDSQSVRETTLGTPSCPWASACASEAGRCLHRAGHSGKFKFSLRSGWESEGSLKPCTERSHRHSAICESNKKCHFKRFTQNAPRGTATVSALTPGSRLTPPGQRGVCHLLLFLTSRKVTANRTEMSQPPPWPHPGLTVPSGLGAPHGCHFSFNQSVRVGPQISHPNCVSRLWVSTTGVCVFPPADSHLLKDSLAGRPPGFPVSSD